MISSEVRGDRWSGRGFGGIFFDGCDLCQGIFLMGCELCEGSARAPGG